MKILATFCIVAIAVLGFVASDAENLSRFAWRGSSASAEAAPASLTPAAWVTATAAAKKSARKPRALPLSSISEIPFQPNTPASITPGMSPAMLRLQRRLGEMTSAPAAAPVASPAASPRPSGVIVPPVPLGPQLRHVDASSSDADNRRCIEFTVEPDGTVSDVRLRNRSFKMQDAMLLSAVKAWRFQPATKDGKPVAYRKVILLTDYN